MVDDLGMGYLGKALIDPFIYAVAIRDGWVIFCESLEEVGTGWYKACQISHVYRDGRDWKAEHCFDRGITFLRTSVIWVADAPNGS
jgi:hypothetical protein